MMMILFLVSLKFGASGYLLKGVSMDGFVSGLFLTVVSGGAMINPDIATKVF